MNMDLPRHQSSFLLRHFREFYREVARLKRMVEYAAPLPAVEASEVSVVGAASASAAAKSPVLPGNGSAAGGSGDGTSRLAGQDNPVVTGVWQQLLSVLESQALEAGQTGGAFAFEIYREAQYVMCALADEIFLQLNWEGRAGWPLLESRLFQSHIAGELVFERLERLLQRRDPFYLDLAAVYFMALSLGFQGKYRGAAGLERLDHYRHQLFAMIYRRNPRLFKSSGALFPQNLQNVLEKSEVRKLPSERVWLALVVVVVVMWIGIAQYAWSSVTNDISCLMCQIRGGNCACQVVGQ